MSPRSRDLTARRPQLTLDPEPYLSCNDCFEQVDARVEALLSRAAEPLTREFRAHVIGCAACLDEAWSLVELATQDVGSDRDTVLARFDQGPERPENRPGVDRLHVGVTPENGPKPPEVRKSHAGDVRSVDSAVRIGRTTASPVIDETLENEPR